MAKEKKLFAGVFGNYTAELKFLLTTLLIFCSVVTILLFIPSRFTISTSDLRVCISRASQIQNSSLSAATPSVTASPPSSDDDGRLIKRYFNPYGTAAYNFITMGAYRGGLNTFAIVGLSSKPLHVYANPTYECEWIPRVNATAGGGGGVGKPITAVGYKMLVDWGFGRVYTAVIVNCTFSEPVNADNSGGRLVLYAATSGGGDANFNLTDRIEALTESPGSLDASIFTSSNPKYDYFYCGSSLYGNLNPQRIREWIAYHVRLFGPKSHFVLHDAGGVDEQVLEVLKPWIELGFVTLQDIRDEERFDGYYHNQFMVVNDCLHRYKFLAKWMFFFDVDEYIYVPPWNTIETVVDSLSEYSQFTIEQRPMSSKICLSEDDGKTYRKWGMEKFVYRDVKRGIHRDRKYAVQPRSVYATGVHMSLNLAGKTTYRTEEKIKYFHYHGSIAERGETCEIFVNSTEFTHQKVPYVLDTTMRDIAGVIKKFELDTIGSRLQNTRQ